MNKYIFLILLLIVGCSPSAKNESGADVAFGPFTEVLEVSPGEQVVCSGSALEVCFSTTKKQADAKNLGQKELSLELYERSIRCREQQCSNVGSEKAGQNVICHASQLVRCGQASGGGACVKNSCPKYAMGEKKKRWSDHVERKEREHREEEKLQKERDESDRQKQAFIRDVQKLEKKFGGHQIYCSEGRLRRCIAESKSIADLGNRNTRLESCMRSHCKSQPVPVENVLCQTWNIHRCLTEKNGGMACINVQCEKAR